MKPFTKIVSILFFLGALVHLFRIFYPFTVFIGGYEIPRAASFIFMVIAAVISAGLWKESKR